jgi:hypothetical protein
MFGFFTTITVAFAAIVIVFRLLEPEITSHLSFWLKVFGELALIYGFIYVVTPRGKFWASPPPDEPTPGR